jgi:hypothetical protein
MCFVVVGTFEPKRIKKKSRTQTTKDTIETINHIMSTDNPISKIFRQLESYVPKPMLHSMMEDEINNKKMGFK